MADHSINGGGINYDLFSPNYKHKLNIYTSMQSIIRTSYSGTGKDLRGYGNTNDFTYMAGGQYTYNWEKVSVHACTIHRREQNTHTTNYMTRFLDIIVI